MERELEREMGAAVFIQRAGANGFKVCCRAGVYAMGREHVSKPRQNQKYGKAQVKVRSFKF